MYFEKEEKRFVFCRCKNDIAEIFHKPIENIIEDKNGKTVSII